MKKIILLTMLMVSLMSSGVFASECTNDFINEFVEQSKDDKQNVSNSEQITGLVIYVDNFNVVESFNPKIYDELGNVVFSEPANDEKITKIGIVGYLINEREQIQNLVGITNNRVGVKPLKIKAIALTDKNQSVVVSNEDAQRILIANEKSKFLKNYKIAFANSERERKNSLKLL